MVWPRYRLNLCYLFYFVCCALSASAPTGDTGTPSSAEKAIIKVGFIYSKTGSESLIENEIGRGIKLFEISQPKGAKKIQIIRADNRGSLPETLAQMRRFREKDIQFVVGLRNSEEALAASQFAEENEMLFLTPLAIFSRVALGKKNSFQISTNEVLQAGALARFASTDLKRKRILVLVNHRSVFSQGFSDSFEKGLKLREGVVWEEHIYNGRDLNLDNLKNKLLTFKPDIVFVSDEITNSAIIAKYINGIDPLIPFLTADPFGNESAMRGLLKEVPKMRVYFSSLWSEKVKTPANDTFKNLYRSQYPDAIPSQEAALTFDALSILNEAIALAADNPSIDRVRYFLEHSKFQTTQGEIDFASGPTHSPVKDVYIKVSNTDKSKSVRTLKAKWKTRP